MRETIEKILQAINECKDPIRNTEVRNRRDAELSSLAEELMDHEREQIEGCARNDDEEGALHWFYTRFISNKQKSRASKRVE